MYVSRTPIDPRYLAGAYADLRRSSWPPTLDAALEQPDCRALIECLARDRQRRAAHTTAPTAVRRARPTAPAAAPRFDAKAARAGEYLDRDDDQQA